MLGLSRQVNPELEHIEGDMRTLRLGREFDAVFVHDAVCYLTTEADLAAAMLTALVHCAPGGVALFAPDHVRDTFMQATDAGGNDGVDGRALRYLEWTYDPDPFDSMYSVDYAYVLHEAGAAPRSVSETHVCGLFSRADWLRLLDQAGFGATAVLPFAHSEVPAGTLQVFIGRKPT